MFSIALALCIGLVPFCVGAQQAEALSPNYNNTQNTIYYFFDYYPSIEKDVITSSFSGYNVVYDAQWVDKTEFEELVNDDYFYGFATGCIVVIDIKTFKPNPVVLNNLFFNLHEIQECSTMFITPYAQQDFSSTAFLSYVDKYNVTDFEKMRCFVEYIQTEFIIYNGEMADTTILLDNRLANIDSTNWNVSMNQLVDRSPFLRIFYDNLYFYGDEVNSYAEFASLLYSQYNIRFLVHLGDTTYVDIVAGKTYTATSVDELQNEDDGYWEHVCAAGFWALDSDFYDLLLDGQSSGYSLTVYIIEIDPIIYGNGLSISPYSSLANIYGEEYDERQEIINELDDLLGQEE